MKSLTPAVFLKTLKTSAIEFKRKKAFMLSAALAYYAIISIIPLLILILTILIVLNQQTTALSQLTAILKSLGGDEIARIVSEIISGVRTQQRTRISLFALVLLLIGGTAFFYHLEESINILWEASPQHKKSRREKILGVIRKRLFAFVAIVLISLFIVVSFITNRILDALAPATTTSIHTFITIFSYVALFALLTVFFVLLYKILPQTQITYPDALPGALTTAALFTVGQIVLNKYLQTAEISAAYGPAGSFIILLIWLYYSSAVFLLGAEFTYVYATTYGSCCKK